MKFKSSFRWSVVLAVVFATTLPPCAYADEGVSRDVILSRVNVRDVSLDTDGAWRGVVTGADGQPAKATEVVVLQGSKTIGLTRTENDGRFVFRDIRPGVYEIATPRSVAVYRVWNAGTAPPAAQNVSLLVEGDTVIRAQEWAVWRRVLILGGVIATSGVIGGVIGYNIKDDAS